MNKVHRNAWLDSMLFITMISLLISSVVLDSRDTQMLVWGLARPLWVTLHAVAGLVLLAGTILHLMWHWDWIKAVVRRVTRPRPATVRRNRTIDIGLMMVFLLATLSGLIIWPMAGNLAEGNPLAATTVLGMAAHLWKSMHAWSGVVMLLLSGIHLGVHWRWIVAQVRRCRAPTPRPTVSIPTDPS